MDFDTIFIAGPQGCGKGTQAKLLAQKTGFLCLGMGSMLREVLAENTDPALVGKVSAINKGILLADDVIIEVIKRKLATLTPSQGVILEGIPRRIGQADFVLDFFRKQGRKMPATILINIPREVSIQRLLLRAKNESRVDDTPEGIETRLKYYEDVIESTMEYLKTKTKFIEVDGTPSIGEVEKSIDTALGI
jgi:adenylate kinase